MNRYLSPDDWTVATWFVASGASKAHFSMSLVNCSGAAVRSFPAGMRTQYEGLTDAQKRAGLLLPPEIVEAGCTPATA